MPLESPSPEVRRVEAGRFDVGPTYRTFRSQGTRDWLVIHTVAGRGRFGNGQDDAPAGRGDTTLLRPGVLHDYGTDPALGTWSIVFAHFHPRPDWASLLDWPQLIPGVMQVHSVGEVDRRIIASLDEAVRYLRGPLPNRERFGLNALEAALLWCETQSSHQGRLDERVLRALDYIDAHLGEELSIAAMASAVALSESRFAHLFSQQIGVSPSRYVETQRLTYAAQLLESTDHPVGAIARQAGFADSLYFSKRFRRYMEQSPLEYRKRTADPVQTKRPPH